MRVREIDGLKFVTRYESMSVIVCLHWMRQMQAPLLRSAQVLLLLSRWATYKEEEAKTADRQTVATVCLSDRCTPRFPCFPRFVTSKIASEVRLVYCTVPIWFKI